MIFDKTKAMRNAERYLTQGKIRAAIGEYKQVVEHDPKDFGTMNMLGDMYAKNAENSDAIKCYTAVADHYSKQGFAQKAIAVFNKVAKLDPDSIEVSAKLAALYKSKGSLMEARLHYTALAEHYQNKGRKIEALAIWKEIASLDPNNTEAYLSLGDSYLQEKQKEDATEAFMEAGTRLMRQEKYNEALSAFERALSINQYDPKAMTAYVEAKFALGQADEAAVKLIDLLEKQPHNRDILFLIVDCHIKAHNTAEAEKAVIKLVEQEPANYPKFLEIAYIYLEDADFVSATRILSMSSEHLLVGGQADAFYEMVSSILERDPEQLDALRLHARYRSWQRDEAALRDSLIKLAEAAKKADSVDDERYALSQLVMIMPHEMSYVGRLREINEKHGFEQTDIEESLFDKKFLKKTAPAFPQFGEADDEAAVSVVSGHLTTFNAHVDMDSVTAKPASTGFDISNSDFESFAIVEDVASNGFAFADVQEEPELSASGEIKLDKEIDSIKFYIESGYTELAEKAIAELREEFGDRPELLELTKELETFSAFATDDAEIAVTEIFPVETIAEEMPFVHSIPPTDAKTFDLDEIRSEFGLEELDAADDADYDTHYHTAVAYQEMGLLEEAIKEFQEAASLVRPNDGTRRFFSCANLLGHCFMQKGMPQLALKWFQRTLETKDLNEDEKQGLWYELAGAYEAEGDTENAGRYFEQVYAENVNFRDVSDRIRNIMVNQ